MAEGRCYNSKEQNRKSVDQIRDTRIFCFIEKKVGDKYESCSLVVSIFYKSFHNRAFCTYLSAAPSPF